MRTGIIVLLALIGTAAGGEWWINVATDVKADWVLEYGECGSYRDRVEVEGKGSDQIRVDSRDYDCIEVTLTTTGPKGLNTVRDHLYASVGVQLWGKRTALEQIDDSTLKPYEPITVVMVKPDVEIEYDSRNPDDNGGRLIPLTQQDAIRDEKQFRLDNLEKWEDTHLIPIGLLRSEYVGIEDELINYTRETKYFEGELEGEKWLNFKKKNPDIASRYFREVWKNTSTGVLVRLDRDGWADYV